jgi:Leucine-rich repeat (LRR) protein
MNGLVHLDIHDNNIIGELPKSICQISTLRVLILRNNSLQGSIPDCISNLSSLQILDLSNNHLVDEIPAKLGNLVGMIETPHTFSQLLGDENYSINVNDPTVNWKKSQQALSNHNLDLYFLLDLSMNQLV